MLSSEHCHSFFVEENPQNVAAVFKAVPTHCPAPEQFPAPTCQGPKGCCWQLSKHPRVFFLLLSSVPALPEAPLQARMLPSETAFQELHMDTCILLLKRCQGENELEDELLKVKHPRDIYQKLLTTQNPEYRGCFSLDMRPEAVTKTQSSVLRVWSKVRWRFNSEVPTQSIFRLIFLIMKSLPFIIHPIYTDRMFRVIARKKCDFSKRKRSGKSQILEKYHPCKGK